MQPLSKEQIIGLLSSLTEQTKPAPIDLRRLAEPFPVDAVSWRVGTTTQAKDKGMALAYIDARDVMERLDHVCGPDWQDKYQAMPDGSYCCSIGIKIDGEWRWRSDGALMLTESDKIDAKEMAQKGSYSDAFKRAAVKWGIGRYLYNLDSPWVKIEARGKSFVIADEGKATLRNVLIRHAKTAYPNMETGERPEPQALLSQPKPQEPAPQASKPSETSSITENAPSKAPASVSAGSSRKTAADVPTVAPGGSRADDWKTREREKMEKREASEKRGAEIKASGSAEVRGRLKAHLDKIKPEHPEARKELEAWLKLAASSKINMTQADQLGITGDYNLKLGTIGAAERRRLEQSPPKSSEEDFDETTGEIREAAE